MTPTTHQDYLNHLKHQFIRYQDDQDFKRALSSYTYELVTLTDLSLDPLRSQLAILYCPTGQGAPYDPCCMLRSLLLMTLQHESSPDRWAGQLRKQRVLAILAGFTPGHTPCATAHRDFMSRFIDGPYEIRKKQHSTLSQTLKGRHERHLSDMTKERKADADREHTTQSDLICRQLLEHADDPRDPNALQTRLDDLFVALGLKPSLKSGIMGNTRKAAVSGDGTPVATAASPDGKKACDCPPNSKDCEHPRLFTSKTAQWCFHVHRGWVFGDEFYTISLSQNGHDFTLITIMGRGNESDFTLSPKAMDELLKMIREHDLPIDIVIFIGDGHHDDQGFYRYLKEKGILSVIPLKSSDNDTQQSQEQSQEQQQQEQTQNTQKKTEKHPQFDRYPNVTFDTDGTPLCPGGCRMRHHGYTPKKDAHFYNCPAARPNKKHDFIFHAQDCPFGKNCCPDPNKKMGHTLYIPSNTNPRYFPEIPRDSKRFKELFAQRTGVERSNSTEDSYHVDHTCRNAVYALFKITLVNCAKHARLRWLELQKKQSKAVLFDEVRRRIVSAPDEVKLLE